MKFATQTLSLAVLLAMAGSSSAAFAQSDPVIGTWELNVAKSKYDPGPPPKSTSRTYTAAGRGYKFVSKAIDAAGTATTTEFTTAYDGKYHPATGSALYDSIMVKRIDAMTTEATLKKGGKVVGQTTRVISADGKTLTSTAKLTPVDGKPASNVEVFDKR